MLLLLLTHNNFDHPFSSCYDSNFELMMLLLMLLTIPALQTLLFLEGVKTGSSKKTRSQEANKNQNTRWGNKLKKKHHTFLHQSKPKNMHRSGTTIYHEFPVVSFLTINNSCSHVGSKLLRFNTVHWINTSKNQWPQHLRIYLKNWKSLRWLQ